jgi:hypothetical protein
MAQTLHYETRDDPDDLPTIHQTLPAAERRARKRSARIGQPVLIYEVTDEREIYLGTA